MDGLQIRGWYHIQKFIPLDWSVIFRWTKKNSINKIALIGRNTCPILAFSGFLESPGSSTSFTYGWLANQRMGSHPKIHPTRFFGDFQAAALFTTLAVKNMLTPKTNVSVITNVFAFMSCLVCPRLLNMDGLQIRGWYHIQKFIPLDWSVIFRWTKKNSINKIALIGRNTCPILAFSGFLESPGLSTSFTFGWLENQRMGSHPKIHPTRFFGDFQAAALFTTLAVKNMLAPKTNVSVITNVFAFMSCRS